MKKRPSKSVIVKWALSYLLIFLIPVLVSLGLLYEVNHYVKNKISFANAQLLEQVKNALDGELENISDTLMEISVNEKLNTVARNSGALTPRSTYMMLELVKNYFPLLSSGNDLVGSLYVFCNEGQFVLTAGAKYSPEVAFETFYPGTGIAYAEWAALMQNVSNFEVQVMPMQGAAGQAASYTNLMLSISFKSDMPAANIVVVLDKNKLAEILKSVQWLNEGYMVVQNQNGDTIYSNLPQALNESLLSVQQDAAAQPRRERKVSERENYILMQTESARWGWRYISVLPKSVFWNDITSLYTITLLALCVCVLAGSLAIIMLLRKNYLPLKKLLKKLHLSYAVQDEANEYQVIDSSVEQIIQQKEEMSEKLAYQHDIAVAGFLSDLLKGNLQDTKKIEQIANSLGLEPWNPYSAVLIFGNGKLSGEDAFNEKLVSKIEWQLRQNAKAAENENSNPRCFGLDISGRLTVLVTFTSSDETTAQSVMQEMLAAVVQELNAKGQTERVVAVSQLFEQEGQLAQAYAQAAEAIEYRIVMPGERVIWFDHIPQEEAQRYRYNFEMERQLVRGIQANDRHTVEKIIDSILLNDAVSADMPLSEVKCLSFNLIGTFVKAIYDLCGTAKEEEIEKILSIEAIMSFENLPELKTNLLQTFDALSAYLAKQKKGKSDALVERCENFIRQKYADSNLNIAMIAQELDVNANYLSRIFKAKKSVGLLDFINQIRIEKAKTLLKESRCSNNEIGAAVGYYNNVAMIRAFKRYEGLTPGEWRKQNG